MADETKQDDINKYSFLVEAPEKNGFWSKLFGKRRDIKKVNSLVNDCLVYHNGSYSCSYTGRRLISIDITSDGFLQFSFQDILRARGYSIQRHIGPRGQMGFH